LPKLFAEVNPIQDIAGEKHIISVSDIEVSQSANPLDICKKKEQTFG
jgi:hypothetical protein